MIWLVRHGETEWSRDGRHTSRTDLELTAHGRSQAAAVGRLLQGHEFASVLCSPSRRARETAQLTGLQAEFEDDLREIDYGEYEGLTTPEIR
ncbi:MAG TPA: histidine phosphatase family protein, partial [Solirubrobacteraceae bacterium]